MKRISASLLAVLCVMLFLFTAYKKDSNLTVEGIVSDTDGQIMYLESISVSTVKLMDSVKLTAVSKFSFAKPRLAFPSFYRLRLNNQSIDFSVDSTETVSFVTDVRTFTVSYSVEGSESCKAIKNITLAQLDAGRAIRRLRKESESSLLADSVYSHQVLEAIRAYKDVVRKYIYSAPVSATACLALFQQIGGLLFFGSYDKNDSKAYSVVTAGFGHYYPGSPHAKHLYNLALQSIKVIRSQRPMDLGKVEEKEVSLLDIELPGVHGENARLSSVAADKVVLINFTAYMSEWPPALNMEFGDLCARYHDKGLEIYQISLDSDLHFWKNAASDLPWTCVHDPQSVYSQTTALYNMRQLPAIFVLDRKGSLVKRVDGVKKLKTDIKSVL